MLEVYRPIFRDLNRELILERLGATLNNFFATTYAPLEDEPSLALNFADQDTADTLELDFVNEQYSVIGPDAHQSYQVQNAFRLVTASLKLDFTKNRYGVTSSS